MMIVLILFIFIFILLNLNNTCIENFQISGEFKMPGYGEYVGPDNCGLTNEDKVVCDGTNYNYNTECDTDGDNCIIENNKLVCSEQIRCRKENGEIINYNVEDCGVITDDNNVSTSNITCSGVKFSCENKYLTLQKMVDYENNLKYGCFFNPNTTIVDSNSKFYKEDFDLVNIDDKVQAIVSKTDNNNAYICLQENANTNHRPHTIKFSECLDIETPIQTKYSGIYCDRNNPYSASNVNCQNQKVVSELLDPLKFISDLGYEYSPEYHKITSNEQDFMHYLEIVEQNQESPGGNAYYNCTLDRPIDNSKYEEYKNILDESSCESLPHASDRFQCLQNLRHVSEKNIIKPYYTCNLDNSLIPESEKPFYHYSRINKYDIDRYNYRTNCNTCFIDDSNKPPKLWKFVPEHTDGYGRHHIDECIETIDGSGIYKTKSECRQNNIKCEKYLCGGDPFCDDIKCPKECVEVATDSSFWDTDCITGNKAICLCPSDYNLECQNKTRQSIQPFSDCN